MLRALALAICALATGCVVEDQASYSAGFRPTRNGGSGSNCPVVSTSADSFPIDANDATTIMTSPGEGVGVFVDYDPGGLWHIWTVCDTSISRALCTFDVTAEVIGGSPTAVAGENLEPGDAAGTLCNDSAYLSVDTGTDTDDLHFTAPPGAPVQITAWLDNRLGSSTLPLIYWADGETARNDASDPVTLTPSSP